MIKRFVLLCALICTVVAQFDQQQVRHLILNDANLIETQRGFAINAPNLLQNNWKTVSVNGDMVQITAPNCQQTMLSKQELMNSMQQQTLITQAKQALYAVEQGSNNQMMGGGQQRWGSMKFSLNGNSVSSGRARNLGMSNYMSDNASITKYDEQNMSFAKPNGGLPDNINRVFVSNDVITFVYQDGRVLMKPAACMSAAEQQLVQQIRMEVQEAERKFQLKMQQFQQNMQIQMQNMHRNLNSNLHNMNQNLNNMFQPGFPFNNQQQQLPRFGNGVGINQSNMNSGFGGGVNQMTNNMQQGYGGINQMNSNFGAINTPFGHRFPFGTNNGGAAAFSQAGPAQASAGANWPFGQNNSPFYPGFPFGA